MAAMNPEKINPYNIIRQFESVVAEWAGAPYAVAVESCSAAIFLSLEYRGIKGQEITIPKRTYPSVPNAIIHAGGKVKWGNEWWDGAYELEPVKVIDSALRFQKDMYIPETLYCLSFHVKKHLPIGRGGMILTDSEEAYKWLKKARFDGRDEVHLSTDMLTQLGWNMYMTPNQAARGLELFLHCRNTTFPDLDVKKQDYPDLSQYKIYET